MNASSSITLITDVVNDLGTVLVDTLPVMLSILTGLIGLGILLRYVRKWIGRK